MGLVLSWVGFSFLFLKPFNFYVESIFSVYLSLIYFVFCEKCQFYLSNYSNIFDTLFYRNTYSKG